MKNNIYNLSYVKNNIVTPIDLSNVPELSREDIHSIRAIDKFTMLFDNEDELIGYLKTRGLVPNDPTIDKLYISRTVKTEHAISENIIYDGDLLLFKGDLNKLNIAYVQNKLDDYKRRPGFLRVLGHMYKVKYKNAPKMYSYSSILSDYGRALTEQGLDILTIGEHGEFEKDLDLFVKKEFYVPGEENILRYRSLREFIIKTNYYIDAPLAVRLDYDRRHSYCDYNVRTNWYYEEEAKRQLGIYVEKIDEDQEVMSEVEKIPKVQPTVNPGVIASSQATIPDAIEYTKKEEVRKIDEDQMTILDLEIERQIAAKNKEREDHLLNGPTIDEVRHSYWESLRDFKKETVELLKLITKNLSYNSTVKFINYYNRYMELLRQVLKEKNEFLLDVEPITYADVDPIEQIDPALYEEKPKSYGEPEGPEEIYRTPEYDSDGDFTEEEWNKAFNPDTPDEDYEYHFRKGL